MSGFMPSGAGSGGSSFPAGTVAGQIIFTAPMTFLPVYSAIPNTPDLAADVLFTASTTTKKFAIQQKVGQTSNLFELQNSAGGILVSFDPSGNVHVTGKLTVDGIIDPTAILIADTGGLAAYLQQGDGKNAAVAPAGTIRLRYDSVTNTAQISTNTGAYLTIDTNASDIHGSGSVNSVPKFTASDTIGDSVISDVSGQVRVNTPAFVDASAGTMITGSTAAKKPLVVQGQVAQSVNLFEAQDSVLSVLFSISQTGDVFVAGKLTVTGAIDPPSVLLSGGTALFFESNDGSTAGVSGAATGRIRYNNTTGTWQVSIQAGAYTDISTGGLSGSGTANTIPKFTSASVIGDSSVTDVAGTVATTSKMTVISGDIQFGTLDPFSRVQIWNKAASSVLRLGSDTADGDPSDIDSEGIVVYHPTGDQLGRIKADRFALTRASDSSLNYFRVDETQAFYTSNPTVGPVYGAGKVHWYVNRASGLVAINNATSGFPTQVGTELLRVQGGTLMDFTATTALQVAQAGGGTPALVVDTTNTRVGIGAAPGAFTLDVTGSARISGKLTVTGAIDPPSVLLSGGTALFFESNDGSTAPVSGAATGRIRYNNTTGTWQLSTQGGAYDSITTSGITGSGTTNQIPKFTSSTALGDSVISDVSGQVRVNTATTADATATVIIAAGSAGAKKPLVLQGGVFQTVDFFDIQGSGGNTLFSVDLLTRVNVTSEIRTIAEGTPISVSSRPRVTADVATLVGGDATLAASSAIAGISTPGAADGGAVGIGSGDGAFFSSGSANGGRIQLVVGSGANAGLPGQIILNSPITPVPTAGTFITNRDATMQVLVVQGFGFQSANLFEAQDSIATVLFSISPVGRVDVADSIVFADTGIAPTVTGQVQRQGNYLAYFDGTSAMFLAVTGVQNTFVASQRFEQPIRVETFEDLNNVPYASYDNTNFIFTFSQKVASTIEGDCALDMQCTTAGSNFTGICFTKDLTQKYELYYDGASNEMRLFGNDAFLDLITVTSGAKTTISDGIRTVVFVDSVSNKAGQFTEGTNTVVLAGGTDAATFSNGSNIVRIWDGTYAINADGAVNITGKLTVGGAIDPTMVLLSGGDKRFGATDAGAVYLAPFTNAVTGVQVRKADNTTVIWNVDTTNSRVGINNSAPTTALDVTGTVTATLFSGSGASLTSIPASAISSGVLVVARGGTNSSTALNNNRIIVSSAGAIVEAAALTNGQLLIGSTGAAPVAASITAGAGLTVTPGAGSITIAATAGSNAVLLQYGNIVVVGAGVAASLQLLAGGSTTVGYRLARAGTITAASIQVDIADATLTYDLQIKVNGTTVATVTLATTTTGNSSAALSVAIAANDVITAFLTKTAGGVGVSSFGNEATTVEVTV